MTEEQRARRRVYDAAKYQANREKCLARSAAWNRDHPGYHTAWARAHPEKHRAFSAAWRKANPEKYNSYNAKWALAHPEWARAKTARRRAMKLRATPAWANHTLIHSFYRMAQLFGLHVDHIVPLKGKTVCGLHVEHNLQLLTVEENSRKGNKLLPEHSNPTCVFISM